MANPEPANPPWLLASRGTPKEISTQRFSRLVACAISMQLPLSWLNACQLMQRLIRPKNSAPRSKHGCANGDRCSCWMTCGPPTSDNSIRDLRALYSTRRASKRCLASPPRNLRKLRGLPMQNQWSYFIYTSIRFLVRQRCYTPGERCSTLRGGWKGCPLRSQWAQACCGENPRAHSHGPYSSCALMPSPTACMTQAFFFAGRSNRNLSQSRDCWRLVPLVSRKGFGCRYPPSFRG